jgi:hypothetical protein
MLLSLFGLKMKKNVFFKNAVGKIVDIFQSRIFSWECPL